MTGQCKIIAFEGVDAIGKETQSIKLVEYFQSLGKKATRVEFPFDSYDSGFINLSYVSIRKMLKNGSANKWPNLFQSLQFCNKFLFQALMLKDLIKSNDYIVLDRWAASMWAYGKASGANEQAIAGMLRVIYPPDITIILAGKSFPKSKTDAYENDKSLQQSVADYYSHAEDSCSTFCDTEWITVNANDKVLSVHENIILRLTEKLNKLL